MRIGIDLDGTINDLHGAILQYGLENNLKISGNGIKNENAYRIIDIFDWEEEECIKFKRYFQRTILNIINPREDVIKCLAKLKEDGNEIYIITGRKLHEMDNTFLETRQWLLKNNIPFDELIIEENDKGLACLNNKIDIFIDDSPKHLSRIKKVVDIKLFIYDNVYNRTVEENQYERVYSFDDIYNKIKKYRSVL